jgi:hypothetical protein
MTSKDLIYRQQAIDEFNCCELTPDGGIDANHAIDVLKQLPSAQPETHDKHTETHACDLISRQAAIDAIDNANDGLAKDDYTYGVQSGMEKAKYVIEELSSAEPQRKKGQWILVSDGYTDCVKCDKCGEVFDVEKNFCPNCGADMRGEQDETNVIT